MEKWQLGSKTLLMKMVEPFKEQNDASNLKAGGDYAEETFPNLNQNFQNLAMEVPSLVAVDIGEHSRTSKIPQISSHSPKRVAFSPLSSPGISNAAPVSPGRPSPSESKSNFTGLTSNMNSQYEDLRLDVEKSPIVPFGGSRPVASQRPRISRSMSLTKLFNPKLERASDSGSSHGECIIEPSISAKELSQRSMHRSYSVPEIREDGSVSLHGNIVCLIPTSPQMGQEIVLTPCKSPVYDKDKTIGSSEHFSEEETVCRICLIELGNGPETIKMECNCRGELALAHQECAIKWFSTKGNRICDVCKQEVRNLPVTLLQAHSVQSYNFQVRGIQPADITQYRVWQDVPFLVIINMLAYFGFLEQLLASDMGSGALAISLPFSCIFGLLASMTAATMVWKQYIWIYATIQLALVIAFSHVFYTKLHMQAILAVLIATFSGFGVTMTLSSMLEKILQQTRSWQDQSTRRTLSTEQPDGSSTITHRIQVDAPLGLQQEPEEPGQPRTLPATLHRGQDQDIVMGASEASHQG